MTLRTIVSVFLVLLAYSSDLLANSVGRTTGTYGLSPTGAATYSIPIWAPRGPNGLEPHIALSYNSQSGNGPLGVGWSLSGFSSIYRCPATYAQDAAPAPVALAYTDRFCLDGKRLRLTSSETLSTYGQAGTTYQTEIADFSNITAEGATGNGPSYFTVKLRNGLTYEYGNGGNSRVLQSGTANAWYLDKITDRSGNSITIAYLAPSGNLKGSTVPSSISWAPGNTITFNYMTPLSVPTKAGYVQGTGYSNAEVLGNITVAVGGTTLKKYVLTYTPSTTTGRQTLTTIQECGGSAGTDCLAATKVGYQSGAAGVASGTALGGTVGSVVSTAYDLNGDGRNDLVMTTSGGALLVAFGGSSGYGTPVATGLTSTGQAIGDVDGSGVDGFLVDVSGTWYYYKWNGSAFVGTSTGISAATAASPVLADLDGDGRADFAYTDSTGLVHVRLSTSTPGTVSFSTDINTEIGTANFSIRAQINGSNRALHFWGSAQADLLGTERTCAQYNAKGICIAYQYIYYTLHFTGSTFSTAGLFPAPLSSPNPAVDFADYNDDGCTDVLTATQLLLSACDGTAPVAITLPAGTTAVGGMDWNGDGRRDVVVAQSSGYLGVVLSTGTGLASTVTNTTYSTSLSHTAAPNLTGDGQDGLIAWNGTSATYYLHASPAAPPDLLTSLTDGYGNYVKPTYVSIAQSNYQESNTAVYPNATLPNRDYIGPMYVVSEAVFNNAALTSGTYNLTYSYYGAWENLQGRGFQGFYEITSTDSRNGLIDERIYDRTFPNAMMKIGHTVSNGTINLSQAQATPNYTTLDATFLQSALLPLHPPMEYLAMGSWRYGERGLDHPVTDHLHLRQLWKRDQYR